ncbi:MAG TPA: 50S ribosomal protein L10 [Candidatus Egerieousia sp.]|nr:50S ribosomal protein L10 [Candidatus Egerieousia sp.]HPT05870.1 50S ribosomal protein L10 [Candidatus Egerieousia sp.]
MKKEKKSQIIEDLTALINENPNFYITDIEGLNAVQTAKLRRICFKQQIKLLVVKNTLFSKALEKSAIEETKQFEPLMRGSSAIMFTTTPNAPAKIIKSFSAADGKGKPALKGALVQDCAYIGAENLDALYNIKSKEELIGDIISLLQSPVKNVISALQSQGGGKIAGIVKTLEEKK